MSHRGIPKSVLIVAEPFAGGLSAERVAGAIAAGISDGAPARGISDCAPLECELCPVTSSDHRLSCLPQMRSSRALLIATPQLDEATMLGSLAFELATEARQAGIPCFAVTGRDDLPAFDARILDLQVVLEADSERSLRRAGRTLAGIV